MRAPQSLVVDDPLRAGHERRQGTSQAAERITQVDAAKNLDAKLTLVERALGKLDDGTYGTCDTCGGPIGDERLEAIPWAVRCVRDARGRG